MRQQPRLAEDLQQRQRLFLYDVHAQYATLAKNERSSEEDNPNSNLNMRTRRV